MQRSLSSMQGMPIMTLKGQRLGEIRDAWLDPSEHRLVAFEVEWGPDQVLLADRVLPVADVVELNADVATVADELGTGLGLAMDFPADADGYMLALDRVLDLPVVDGEGARLGVVKDVLFDPQDGSIRSYELEGPDAQVLLLTPHRSLAFDDGDALVVAEAARAHLVERPAPRLDVTLLEELGIDEPQGEDDLEVARQRPLAEP